MPILKDLNIHRVVALCAAKDGIVVKSLVPLMNVLVPGIAKPASANEFIQFMLRHKLIERDGYRDATYELTAKGRNQLEQIHQLLRSTIECLKK